MRSTTNKASKISNAKSKVGGENSSSNQISVHESRVLSKAGQPSRKVNNLQDNMQFIKELHKTKSLKHLTNNEGHLPVTNGLKKGMMAGGIHSSDKMQAESLKQFGGGGSKAIQSAQYSNMTAKMLIGSQANAGNAGHQKKLSSKDMSSKFLAGVKGSHGQVPTSMMHQTMKTAGIHNLYSNGGPGSNKKGSADHPRKLIKSTSHL